MRYLAWLLLVTNLGVLVWIISQPAQQPPQHHPIPVPHGVEPLVLLSERDSKTGIEQKPPQAARDAEPPGPVASMDDQQRTVGTEAAGDKNNAPESADAEVDPQVELVCQTIGPFTSEADAQTISTRLSGQGYAPRTRSGAVRKPSGYWVYLPAMPAYEARRIVAELEANGMKDYYIGKRNYISLGIFSSKDKAQSRLKQVQALGFDAKLERRYRKRSIYWLDIEKPGAPLLGTALWTEIQAQYADIRVQQVSCDE